MARLVSRLARRAKLSKEGTTMQADLNAHGRSPSRSGGKPRIAVFAGATATVLNSPALVTSNKARQKYGLPLPTDAHGQPLRWDQLRAQRLAAPVTVYIEQFSAHPLERDVAELYAPPDG